MKNIEKPCPTADGDESHDDCTCDGNCCPPKKNNKVAKIIFAVIILAAFGVIAFKFVSNPEPAAVKENCCPPKFSTGYDTSKTAACDTTKGSSCCPK